MKKELVIKWFNEKKGNTTYSMIYRNGPRSYDCSSSVFYALIYAKVLPKNHKIGNTDDLFYLADRGILKEIRESEVSRGDIFIAGVKGNSAGAGGHTGVFTSKSTIIHCSYSLNGIYETVKTGHMGEYRLPVRFFKIVEQYDSRDEYEEIAHFIANTTINVREYPSLNSKIWTVIKKGEGVDYDRVVINDGYVWISFFYKKKRRYIAVRNYYPKRGELWGKIIKNSKTQYEKHGKFKANYEMNIRENPSLNAKIVGSIPKGYVLNFDHIHQKNGYEWISYIAYSKNRRFVAKKNLKTKQEYGKVF
ncbi:MAG: peptidoglycan amidohydrolase family protein [Tissierellia bacterium]|nr:peptidoglycan amidohydrolase family protein [Tissierellia bacterium]